jgi:hypothetical protein
MTILKKQGGSNLEGAVGHRNRAIEEPGLIFTNGIVRGNKPCLAPGETMDLPDPMSLPQAKVTIPQVNKQKLRKYDQQVSVRLIYL